MLARATLTLGLLLLAGCLGSEPAGPDAVDLEPVSFGPPLTMACPPGATYTRPEGVCVARVNALSSLLEPYLAAHPDGTTYALGANEIPAVPVALSGTRPGTAAMHLRLFLSRDAGATWDDVPFPPVTKGSEPVGNFSGGDPVVAFGADGALHFAGMFTDQRLGAIEGNAHGLFHLESRDLGATWDSAIVSAGPGDDRPWLAVRDDGVLAMAWQNLRGAGEEDDAGYVRLRVGGQWGETLVLPKCVQPGVPLFRDGALLVACRQTSFADGLFQPRVWRVDLAAQRADALWTGPSIPHGFPRLVDVAGRLVLLLPLAGDAFDQVVALHSADGGATWSGPADLAAGDATLASFGELDVRWAAAGPDGRLHVLFGGGPSKRLAGDDPLAPPARPVAYAAVDVAADGLRLGRVQVVFDGLAEGPADEPVRLGALGYCCDDYAAIAFAGGSGLLAWSRDGAIDVTALVPA